MNTKTFTDLVSKSIYKIAEYINCQIKLNDPKKVSKKTYVTMYIHIVHKENIKIKLLHF
jgi:hypothetical protein